MHDMYTILIHSVRLNLNHQLSHIKLYSSTITYYHNTLKLKHQPSNLTYHSPCPGTNTSKISNAQPQTSQVSNAQCHTSNFKPQTQLPHISSTNQTHTFSDLTWMRMVDRAIVCDAMSQLLGYVVGLWQLRPTPRQSHCCNFLKWQML